MKAPRGFIGLAAGALVFAAMSYASSPLYLIAIRETLQAAEWAGIMNPNGSLGGQVAGFNYQREPGWVYSVGQVLGAAVAFGPGMVLALLVMERVRGSWRVTLCGKCGARMRARVGGALTGPEGPGESVAHGNVRCGACGGEL